MKVRVYMPKKHEVYEEKSRDYVTKKISKSINTILESFDSLVKKKDITGIFKYFAKEIEKKAYYLLSSDWMKQDKSLVEKIGFTFKLPGLKEGEERYAIYILMAYSKGFVIAPSSAHHPGDLERVIILTYPYRRGKRTYYYLNTAAHGSPVLFKEHLGVYDSLEKALECCSFYFKPGDHAVGLIKNKELKTYETLKNRVSSFLDKSRIFKNLSQITKNIFKKVGTEKETREPYTFYLISPDEIKENLDIDFEGYLERVIYLDSKLPKLRKKSTDSTQRSIISKLEKILWRTPIINVDDELKSLYKIASSKKLLDSEVLQKMRELQLYSNEIEKKINDLRKESFYDLEEYLRNKSIQKFSEISISGKLTIPVGLEMLLQKPLNNWAYPEKNSSIGKIERVFFSISDIFYRTFQKITITLSR